MVLKKKKNKITLKKLNGGASLLKKCCKECYSSQSSESSEDCFCKSKISCKSSAVPKKQKTSKKKTAKNKPKKKSDPCKTLMKKWMKDEYAERDMSRNNRNDIVGNNLMIHTSSEKENTKCVDKQWYSGEDLSKKKAISKRNKIIQTFNVHENIQKKLKGKGFTWINQGNIGGCSFACLSHLCQLGNIQTPWDISSLTNERNFGKVYKKQYSCDDSGYNDWYSVISSDFCVKIENFYSVLQYLNFQPFKSRGSIHIKLDDVEEGSSSEEYAVGVFNYIITLLDQGFVVGIPFLQHFITVIGYKGDQLLFLGSFGPNYDYGGLHVLDKSFIPMMVGDAIKSCIYVKVQ